MRILGNIVWIICGGLISALVFLLAGVLLCVTIIGIPWGVQCFKLAGLSFSPFGKEIERVNDGLGSILLNILWILLFGWEFALTNLLLGALLCITIIGIPFGKQFFKIAGVSFLPFGMEIRTAHIL